MSKPTTIGSICCAPADNVSREPAIRTGIVEECIQCCVEVMLSTSSINLIRHSLKLSGD